MKNKPEYDKQSVISSASKLVAHLKPYQAVADFFTTMTAQKAHWYSIASCSFSDSSNTLINQIPPIPSLLSINPEIMDFMLQQCGLSLVRRDVSFQNMNSWHTFIAEYHVDIEVTTFLLLNKRQYFIRIGSWISSKIL